MVAFLADEDLPGPIARALTGAGVDLVRIQAIGGGVSDDTMLERARALGRVLITRDVGFGERVVRDGVSVPGIILVRLRGPNKSWSEKSGRVIEAINELGDAALGAISTVDWTAVRTRRLSGCD